MVVLYDGQYGIHNDRLPLGALGFRFVVHSPSGHITNSEKQIKGDWRWYMPPQSHKEAETVFSKWSKEQAGAVYDVVEGSARAMERAFASAERQHKDPVRAAKDEVDNVITREVIGPIDEALQLNAEASKKFKDRVVHLSPNTRTRATARRVFCSAHAPHRYFEARKHMLTNDVLIEMNYKQGITSEEVMFEERLHSYIEPGWHCVYDVKDLEGEVNQKREKALLCNEVTSYHSLEDIRNAAAKGVLGWMYFKPLVYHEPEMDAFWVKTEKNKVDRMGFVQITVAKYEHDVKAPKLEQIRNALEEDGAEL
jgi:hypothetical protein